MTDFISYHLPEGAELDVLYSARDAHVEPSLDLDGLTGELKAINEALWDIENGVREIK